MDEMTNDELRHAQETMLFIMDEIHKICIKNNIKYWLDYGSLLGAIRHNGFIPWDDDFDICMLRKDYDRFDKIAQKELGDRFFWQTYKSDKHWNVLEGKVRLKGTVFLEKTFEDAHLKENGFFVDVFPFDYTYGNAFAGKLHLILATLVIRPLQLKMYKKYRLKWFLPMFIPRSVLLFLGNMVLRMKRKSQFVTQLCTCPPCTHTERFDTIDKVVLHKFDKYNFYIPLDYHTRLSRRYGNYMIPPKKEEQNGHHNIVKIDFGRY